MKAEENAAIILLAEAMNDYASRCRALEDAFIDLHKRYDKVRAENDKLKRDGGNKLKNVNV